jgi:diguanylate cyclase (GGDEF)-like protein
MASQAARPSWCFAALGLVFGASSALFGVGVANALYVVAMTQLVVSVIVAARTRRLEPGFLTLTGLVGLCYLVADLVSSDAPAYEAVLPALFGLMGTVCIIAAIAIVLRRRRDGMADGVVGDALIVGLGGWILSWVVLVEPVLANSTASIPAAVLFGFTQPTACVLLFMMATLIFTRLERPPALWLLATALFCSVAGDLVYALMNVGHLGIAAEQFGTALYVVAYFFGTAAILHPTMRGVLASQPEQIDMVPFGRLIVTTLALVIPMIALTVSGPRGTTDMVVRAVSASILAGAVTLRVVYSVRANARAQKALVIQARNDPLTGLPNRTVVLEHADKLLNGTHGDAVTLYFVDLDRFKGINDSLGHGAGDEALRIVASRLSAAAPESAIVARLSGDEFVILKGSASLDQSSTPTADRLMAVFAEPLALSAGDVFLTASIGVAALGSGVGATAADLIRRADTAMYRAKSVGRNCVAVFDESMRARAAHRLELETALHRALDRHELQLFHQPILDLSTGTVTGFEALMRWRREDGSDVSPAEFIPIAEDSGLIVTLGSWALLEATSQLRHWIDDETCPAGSMMSVNVSPRQLEGDGFYAIVREALHRSRLPAKNLWLEVTESTMIDDPEQTLRTLEQLRDLGVRVALDDFGTGYSSLSLLQRFPLQRIKIDRAFVNNVAHDGHDRALVRTILAMGESLGLEVVAEGVETIEQLDVLTQLGCTHVQGYLISRPVHANAMRGTLSALADTDISHHLGDAAGRQRQGSSPERHDLKCILPKRLNARGAPGSS